MSINLWLKKLGVLSLIILIIAGLIACSQDGELPRGTNEQEEPTEVRDNDSKAEEQDQALVPNPTVDVTEGMDYFTVDVAAKDFELEDLKGNKVKLSDYEGRSFLNFGLPGVRPVERKCRIWKRYIRSMEIGE